MNPVNVDTEHASKDYGKGGLEVGSSEPIVYLSKDVLGWRWRPSVGDDVIKDETCSS